MVGGGLCGIAGVGEDSEIWDDRGRESSGGDTGSVIEIRTHM